METMRTRAPFYGLRFCVTSGTLHDLLFEKAGCDIDNIDPANIHMFQNKDEALKTGAQPCRFCLRFESKSPF